MIMTRIQSALEVTDSQPLLVAIVDIVLIVAHRYSDTFHSHFHVSLQFTRADGDNVPSELRNFYFAG